MTQEKKKLYSYHTFMLPFKYNIKDKGQITQGWTKGDYTFSYNETTYFHEFFMKSFTSMSYYTKKFATTEFVVKKSQEYRLTLESTNIKLFDKLGVGVLTINLKNSHYCSIKAILEINDYVRRLYPEYLDYKEKRSGLVPEYIEFNGIKEKFEFDEKMQKPEISTIINQFIPVKYISKAVDDRMFVISFYENAQMAGELKENYLCHDQWYEYVFIDGNGKSVQNEAMQKKLIEKATYPRWQGYGRMYGMSKYSFVCLSESDFPLEHMQTMYQSMFVLLLIVRATLLKFSQDVSEVAKNLDYKDIPQRVNDLYKGYIEFVNEFYFREITAKDQGLEIYEQAIATLNIVRDIKDLDAEIEELHKYVDIQQKKEMEKEAEETNKKLNKISLYGGVILVASFMTGFFGMNVGDDANFAWVSVLLAIIIPSVLSYKFIFKKEHYE